MKAKTTKTPARPIYEIANEIKKNWKKEISGTELNYAAKPYLFAMYSLDKITDNYLFDSGKDVVARFLNNATSWRGETARRIKKELNAMLKSK